MNELLIANSVAAVLILLALGRVIFHRRAQTEEERAVIVMLLALVMLSATGLARRSGYEHTELVATVAWTIVATVAVWVMTKAPGR